MKPSDVVPYLNAITGKAWLAGQEVPEDNRTPTPAQLLALPAQPAIVGANVLVGDADYYGWDANVQAILSKHATAGGIIVLCWHPPNFFLGSAYQSIGSAWASNANGSKPDLTQLTNPTGTSTAKNRYLRAITRLITYIQTLPSTAPIIFRPWHEASESWAWWGADLTNPGRSETGVRALWADTITRVQQACPNVLSGWSAGESWYEGELYGYPSSMVPDIVGSSLYSDTMDFAHTGDYDKLAALGRPMILFEVGPATQTAGWDARKLLTALTTRYQRFAGWVSWQDWSSLLEMSNSGTVLADPRVVTRDKLPIPTQPPQQVGTVYAASKPGVDLFDAPTSAAQIAVPVWKGSAT